MANPLGTKLLEVRKPARYIGGEYGAACKSWDDARLRWCLAFPGIYEIGMSNLGLQILYRILNNQEGILADRAYCPWFDMEDLLKREKQLLWGMESGRPLSDFDIIGITIPYELTYTNIVSLLKIGGISPLAKDRKDGDPLVIGGGCGAFNPEPVADFFDAILIGDGEEAVVEISAKIAGDCHTALGAARNGLLAQLSSINGLYIPSRGINRKIRRRVAPDLNEIYSPDTLIVPNLQLVHDRVGVEIQRGCTRGCRFCHAGMIYRPARQRDKDEIKRLAKEGIDRTGYEECALLSLSASDHADLADIITGLDDDFRGKWAHISLPSLRTEGLDGRVVQALSRSLKGGFTMAPEAATDRLRRVINKGNTEGDLMASVEKIFESGWKNLKLYFMIGLPGETDEDIAAIPILVKKVLSIGRKVHKYPNITVNISTYVPKAHTPFQWERQISLAKTKEIHRTLRDGIKGPGLKLKLHNPEVSFLEGIFARGGRELSGVISRAFDKGCRFDAWDDQMRFDKWMEAFSEAGIDPSPYLDERAETSQLPWDHLFADLDRAFLIRERVRARAEELTPDCRGTMCAGCGVCDFERVKPMVVRGGTEGPSPQPSPSGGEGNAIHRYRIRFAKTGDAIFIGHLDLMNIWRRALRRADLPLRYSQGFNPRPKISFVRALRVGEESCDEWFEVELTQECNPAQIIEAVANLLPPGIGIMEVVDHESPLRNISSML